MKNRFLNFFLAIGYLFLYLPLICIIIYSFNESRFVNIWSGFSFKWYESLFSNNMILRATITSVKIASMSATVSVVLGTLAALAITRFSSFKSKTLFMGLITAPLVMPEVVIGLSLLLLFITMDNLLGWPNGRSILTVTIAHITLTISYVTMFVQSRLADMDKSIEEAALDLGATPLKVFFLITLPNIMPAVILAWFLAFALSFDDVVIASFVSGPGATTLPMIVFSNLRFGITPEINALAAIIMGFLSIVAVVVGVVIYRREKSKM